MNNVKFDTGSFFSGGGGLFIEYHDILKPTYLYAVIKMIICDETYGLPVHLIKQFSIRSILEWYVNRRYINPLKQLDFMDKINLDELNSLLNKILQEDHSIHKISPQLNICRLFDVYRRQYMSFPVFIYSDNCEEGINKDCKDLLSGIEYKYVYGDLKNAISQCDNNYTYIFSDIEKVNMSAKILKGTYSHILLADDYRYNYSDNELKYDLNNLMMNNPIVRTGLIQAIDYNSIDETFSNIII